MATDGYRLMVAVFDQHERVERAASQLRDAGHDGDGVHIIGGHDVPQGYVADLVAGGVSAEASAYYEGEVLAGRWLLTVSCLKPDVSGVLGAFGRHGGSVRVPAEIRDGRA